jgi:hypothetical protein
MVNQLQATALPTLQRLLDRQTFVQTVRAGDLGFLKSPAMPPTYFDQGLAILLADEPSSSALAELLATVELAAEPRTAVHRQRLADWVRERQRMRAGTGG